MTLLITVFGIVQGVGYRPFVARLAEELSIAGTVLNSGGIVQIIASSPSGDILAQFAARLKTDQPQGANVLEIRTETIPEQAMDGFHIIPSSKKILTGGLSEEPIQDHPLIPADLPLCETCRKEMYDPDNRRYLYPFISCVACGPRYSIIKEIPYDRDTVTMDIFPMCPACGAEYTENDNRRRHAQTISCHDCGPQLILQCGKETFHRHGALLKSVELLKQGKVLAIKGTGGYQLACLPTDVQAVENLRLLKKRDKKPFAVMFPDLAGLEEYCETGAAEEELLLSAARPIVLLQKKQEFCAGVSDESRFTGAYLPYTPLHQLLTDACGPLVMTSGNLTSNPIIYRDEEILGIESPYLAGVLYNERRITTPLDDSVVRAVPGGKRTSGKQTSGKRIGAKQTSGKRANEEGESSGDPSGDPFRPQLVRRSRGYVPIPVVLKQNTQETILALGGDLKSSFCLYHHHRAYISQYFGDMENYLVSTAYQENVERMKTLFGMNPEIIVRDLHPQYFTTRLAEKLAAPGMSTQESPGQNLEQNPGQNPGQSPAINVIPIQHHHAHAASVMAEHDLSSCIGVVFDGTGYGTDGAVWGGEFLLCKGKEYTRCAHLGYVTLCGGDTVARNAGLAAQCYLLAGEETGKIVESDETSQEKNKNDINDINNINDIDNIDNDIDDIKNLNEIKNQKDIKNKKDIKRDEQDTLRSAIRSNINTQQSSSMGRLFDAVSAILNIRKENSYEAECAIALENEAARFAERLFLASDPINRSKKPDFSVKLDETSSEGAKCDPTSFEGTKCDLIHFKIDSTPEGKIIDQVDLFHQIHAIMEQYGMRRNKPEDTVDFADAADIADADDMKNAAASADFTGALAYAFHQAIAGMVRTVCMEIRKESGENKIALSGGVFANLLLLQNCMEQLENEGFSVYINSEVPTNDGGICLGQAWLCRT